MSGLAEGAVALKVAFDRLFPDGVVDRTDLRIASNNSACGGDVAAYLTGARTRFGSHLIDSELKDSDFVVQWVSSGKIVRVVINAATYPRDVRAQMKRFESGSFAPAGIDLLRDPQWAYAKKLVSRPAIESVDIPGDPANAWSEPPCKDMGLRRDNHYKNAPGRAEP